jgi:predicted RNase H-like nuclease
MATILAIDAAWTQHEPSGVALVSKHNGLWRCVAVAPSYASFIALSENTAVDWQATRFAGNIPQPTFLLSASQLIAKVNDVDLVTVDMPVATAPIQQRRRADNEISRQFGGVGCSAHSPTPMRPGVIGHELSSAFLRLGYQVAGSDVPPGTPRRLVEVYPHPALLTLLQQNYRVPYKVAKTTKYWRGASTQERRERVLAVLNQVYDALANVFGPLGFELPGQPVSFSELKRYEDVLDALVCAWVGTQYIDRQAFPLGDEEAAIWCPLGGA